MMNVDRSKPTCDQNKNKVTTVADLKTSCSENSLGLQSFQGAGSQVDIQCEGESKYCSYSVLCPYFIGVKF